MKATPVGEGRMVAGLALSVSVSYGALFYAFSVLITDDAAGAAFTTGILSAAFGGSILVGAATAPVIGRLADRHGIRAITLVGAALGAIGLVAFAHSTESWQVLAVWWAVLGPATAMTFYEPAYVAIDQWCPPERRTSAIAVLTLSAGLSGPVSIPATAWSVEQFGWRPTTQLLAAAIVVVLVPVALLALRGAPVRHGADDLRAPRADTSLLRVRRFILFTAGAVLVYGAFEAAVLHRIARFEQAGFDVASAARWAAIAGLISLPGRFFLPRLAASRSPTVLLGLVAGVLAVATALAVRPTTDVHLAGHFVLSGLVLGAALPLRAVAMSRWYSGRSYGWVMGVQAGCIGVARAAGPVVVGLGRQHLGDVAAMAGLVAAFVAGAALVILSDHGQRIGRRTRPSAEIR
jgi:MFS family permease